jgi:trimeric autotransporter adhesin
VKATLVYLILACVSVSPAQEPSPNPRESVNVQRLLKFSGALTGSHRPGIGIGTVALHFTIYNESYGGKPYWQETVNVDVNAQGRYTVLLGETAVGGLPPSLLASRATHWLGVQASGQPEEARVLLVESAQKVDPVAPSSLIGERVSPYSASDRNLALILLIMFLVGSWIACGELRKWWKTHTEQYGEPPVNLLRFVPSPDKLQRAAQLLQYPFSR